MLIMAFPNWWFVRQKLAGGSSCGDGTRGLAVMKSKGRGDPTETPEFVERNLIEQQVTAVCSSSSFFHLSLRKHLAKSLELLSKGALST